MKKFIQVLNYTFPFISIKRYMTKIYPKCFMIDDNGYYFFCSETEKQILLSYVPEVMEMKVNKANEFYKHLYYKIHLSPEEAENLRINTQAYINGEVSQIDYMILKIETGSLDIESLSVKDYEKYKIISSQLAVK